MEKRSIASTTGASCSYTVTKANQNEALLWKIVVLGTEKAPC